MTNEARLVLVGDASQWWALGPEGATLGREAPATIVLGFAAVSRLHARVAIEDGALRIADLGSRNGTFVNGVAVGADGRLLAHGDEIVLGGAVALRVEDAGRTAQGPRIGRLRGVWMSDDGQDAWVDARRVEPPLSPQQLALLRALYAQAGRVVSRDALVAATWPTAEAAGVSEEALDGVVKRLRKRLRETSALADYVEVVRGHGIRLAVP